MSVEPADVVKCCSWDGEIILDYPLGPVQTQGSFISLCQGKTCSKGEPETENEKGSRILIM